MTVQANRASLNGAVWDCQVSPPNLLLPMRNLEAKFPLTDFAAARAQLDALGFVEQGALLQRDTFFRIPHGKLKLREQPDGAWLIHYQRGHHGAFELSNYTIVEVANSPELRAILSAALGVRVEVSKQRLLLLRRNVRVHLDEVSSLGRFGEIELILGSGDDPNMHDAILHEILRALEVAPSTLLEKSYFEMLDTDGAPD